MLEVCSHGLGLVALIFCHRADGRRAILEGSRAQPIEVAYAISLPAWIFVLVSGNSSSASPDSISFCLMLHLFLVFACFLVSGDTPERSRNLGEILFLGATCLCVNLNSLAFVGGIVIVCGVSLLLGQRRASAHLRQKSSSHDGSLSSATYDMGRAWHCPFRLSVLSLECYWHAGPVANAR